MRSVKERHNGRISHLNNETGYEEAREGMVRNQLERRGIRDRRVVDAMRQVPRHRFVPEQYRDQAYADRPIPIGENQTISQPYVVALMTQMLALDGDEKVLEIGTGSGYQAAVLSRLAYEVFTVERYASLAHKAQNVLEALRYDNVQVKVSDGSEGWPENGPYQGIIVTAGAPGVPKPLKRQLDDGGCLVVPIGSRWSQTLVRLRRLGAKFVEEKMTGVRFVPLVGAHGWAQDDGREKAKGNGLFPIG